MANGVVLEKISFLHSNTFRHLATNYVSLNYWPDVSFSAFDVCDYICLSFDSGHFDCLQTGEGGLVWGDFQRNTRARSQTHTNTHTLKWTSQTWRLATGEAAHINCSRGDTIYVNTFTETFDDWQCPAQQSRQTETLPGCWQANAKTSKAKIRWRRCCLQTLHWLKVETFLQTKQQKKKPVKRYWDTLVICMTKLVIWLFCSVSRPFAEEARL